MDTRVTPGKPVLLTVDDDPGVSRAVARDLRRRYGEAHRIVRATSGQEALEALKELKLRGEPVAAMLADYRMPEMNGIEFLEQAMDLFPRARRALLTAYADTDAAIQAINLVDVDHYLLKPWDPPEEKLYPVVDALIETWRATGETAVEEVKIIGHRWSAPTFAARDFLARNAVPYRYYSIDEPEGRRLLDAAAADPTEIPVVVTPDGRALLAPSDAEIAAAVGLTVDPATDFRLTKMQEKFIARMASAPELSPMRVADLEDELGEWFDDHDVPGGWDLAPVFVAAGITTPDLDELSTVVDPGFLSPALRWLSYTVETENLLLEVKESTKRISALVGAAKQYSQLDRAPHQTVDIHEGLKATLVMLAGKIGQDVRVVKDFDHSLPKVPVYAAELNQVWTNLIDNALDAIAGNGTLTVRTALDGDSVLVEVVDTGPGVPEALRRRVFEPFFTTKGVGQGTGLGLDVSWRVVVNRHGGDLRVISAPGDTHFQVRLPLHAPTSD